MKTAAAPSVTPDGARVLRIAGGGLAGLSLGLLLTRQGFPVEIHEASTYPRHRVCGEFLSGLREQDLAKLGLDLPPQVLRHQTSVWYHTGTRLLEMSLPEPALAISRHWLDHRLAEAFTASGGTLRTQSRVQPEGEGWISATGRRPVEGGWAGIKAHYRSLPLEAGLEMHLGRGGYVGLTAVEDSRVNVSALVPPRYLTGREKRFLLPSVLEAMGLETLARRLREAAFLEESLSGVTRFQPGWHEAPAPLLPIGDALAAIPPFSGHGMTMAIEGSVEAAPFLASWLAGTTTWTTAREAALTHLRRHFHTRMAWALRLHGWITGSRRQDLLAWTARLHLLPVQFLYRKLRG